MGFTFNVRAETAKTELIPELGPRPPGPMRGASFIKSNHLILGLIIINSEDNLRFKILR